MSWRATLRLVVTESTTEVEYMAIAEACKESVWLKSFYAELVEIILALTCFVATRVQYNSLRIRCSMIKQSTLMSNTVIFETLLSKVY